MKLTTGLHLVLGQGMTAWGAMQTVDIPVVTLYKMLGGPKDQSGRVRKISPSMEFDHRTVQAVASRYIVCAIPAQPYNKYTCFIGLLLLHEH